MTHYEKNKQKPRIMFLILRKSNRTENISNKTLKIVSKLVEYVSRIVC